MILKIACWEPTIAISEFPAEECEVVLQLKYYVLKPSRLTSTLGKLRYRYSEVLSPKLCKSPLASGKGNADSDIKGNMFAECNEIATI